MGAKWGCVDNKEGDTVCEFTMREVLCRLVFSVLPLVFGLSALMARIHSKSQFSLFVLALLILVTQFLALVHSVVVFLPALVQFDEDVRTRITPGGRDSGFLHLLFGGYHFGYGVMK